MATYDVRRVLRVPGRLCINPTNLANAFPCGGTDLGAVRGIELRQDAPYYALTAEEFGFEPVEYLERGTVWGLSCVLRGWDANAIATLFPNTSTGTTTGEKVIAEPGSVRAGIVISGRSVKLAFVPDNADGAPTVLLYKALPLIAVPFQIDLSRHQEMVLTVAFVGIRDASARVMAMGMRRDLTL
jgi:hypothetical protein